MRQIVLDTETTGMRIEDGHRVIEIGCVEMIDRKLTGKEFHHYVNPGREVEAGALEVHGISNEFLKNKASFEQIANEWLEFIEGAELIIHNAPFDLSFLNHELMLIGKPKTVISDSCRVVDTLKMARQLHAGQRNSLDALCKRYGVDNSKRGMHGALLDAHLLAQVYLAMTGGQGSFFDSLSVTQVAPVKAVEMGSNKTFENQGLLVLPASEQELIEHESYLRSMKEQGKCVWLEE